MKMLVVGLVDRPAFLALQAAAERRGHRLHGSYSTELVIEASEAGFVPRLRGRDLMGYDVILPFTLGLRKWDWYVAALHLQARGGPRFILGRPIEAGQSAFISPAYFQLRAAELGLPALDVSIGSGPGISLKLAEELGFPVTALPVGPGVRKRARLCANKSILKEFLDSRGERAFLMRSPHAAETVFRVLVTGGRVAGALRLSPPVAPGEAKGRAEALDPKDIEGLEAIALPLAAALELAVVELDLVREGPGSPLALLEVEESLDRMALESYRGDVFGDIVAAVEAQAGQGRGSGRMPTGGVSLSVAILSREGASTLPRLLRQVRPIADEIIVAAITPTDKEIRAVNRRGDRLIPLPEGCGYDVGWNAAMGAAQGTHILLLRESDVFDAGQELAIRARIEAMDPASDALILPYSRLRDAFGHPRHLRHVPRVLRRVPGLAFEHPRCESLVHAPERVERCDIPLRYDPPAHRRTRERAEALEMLGPGLKAGDIPPTLPLMVELGEAQVRAKAYDVALPLLEVALALPAQRGAKGADGAALRARGGVLLALCHLRLGDVAASRAAAEAAMAEDPSLAEPARIIGEGCLKGGDLKGARQWLELSHRLPLPTQSDAVYPYWYVYGTADLLSVVWDKLGSPQAALAYLEEVEAAIPGTQRVAANRAKMEQRLARIRERAGGR